MRSFNPFFPNFSSRLFGRPPVSPLTQALAKLRQSGSLSVLVNVFGSYISRKLLSSTPSCAHSRKRIFSLERVFWSFLDQVQTPNGSCREAVCKVMALVSRKSKPSGTTETEVMSGNTSAYCQARAKLPVATLEGINTHLAVRMEANIPSGALWHGRQVRLVDGTGVSMPDTEANQDRWPQSSSQKPGCGFPAINLVGVFCLLTGALLKADWGDRLTHETRLFRNLWSIFNRGDLVLTDRGFCSFGAIAGLLSLGVDSLMRLPEKRIRKAIGAQLPKSANFDVNIVWKRPAQRPRGMTPEEFALWPADIPVRVVRYTIAQPGFRTQTVTLVTTLLLSETAIPADDLASLYFRRWSVELHFREIKIALNMDVLRCKSPALIERELLMHFIAYNLVRSVMQKAALIHELDLDRVSFKGTLDTVRQFANATSGANAKPRTISAILDAMLSAIASDLVPLRPDRSEPRVRKRRPKNYRLLTKPRRQMGPLPHRKSGVENPPKSPLS